MISNAIRPTIPNRKIGPQFVLFLTLTGPDGPRPPGAPVVAAPKTGAPLGRAPGLGRVRTAGFAPAAGRLLPLPDCGVLMLMGPRRARCVLGRPGYRRHPMAGAGGAARGRPAL